MAKPKTPCCENETGMVEGTLVYPKARKGKPGRATGGRGTPCGCCGGEKLTVIWPDGERTRPCTGGMVCHPDGSWEIN